MLCGTTNPSRNELPIIVSEVRLLGTQVVRARGFRHSALVPFEKITHIWLWGLRIDRVKFLHTLLMF